MMNEIFLDRAGTYSKYGLKLAALPIITPPEINLYSVEVPYRSGAVDLTEALTGYPTYKDRAITFTLVCEQAEQHKLAAFINDYHGRKIKARHKDWMGYYYIGRVSVGEYERTDYSKYISIPVSITVEPAAYAEKARGGIVNKTANESAAVVVDNRGIETTIKWDSDAAATVEANGATYHLEAGADTIPGFYLARGRQTLTISGAATSIKWQYTERRL